MEALEQLLALFVAAMILAAIARRVGAPYPVFLALGGMLLAFIPGAPSVTLPPELALALFVAPVLLDAAYDASPLDPRDNWVPVTGLVVVAVGLTTAAAAVVAHAIIPSMPWAAAVALGAVAAGGFSMMDVAPTFLLAVAGSLVAGPALGWLALRLFDRVEHVPTSIILQFVTTFGVWILAEQVGLSGVLTTVCYAMTLARSAPA